MEENAQHATLQEHSQQRAPLIGNTVNQRAISPCWHCQKTLLDRPLNSILAEGRDFFPKFVTLFIHGFSGEFLNITVVSFLGTADGCAVGRHQRWLSVGKVGGSPSKDTLAAQRSCGNPASGRLRFADRMASLLLMQGNRVFTGFTTHRPNAENVCKAGALLKSEDAPRLR